MNLYQHIAKCATDMVNIANFQHEIAHSPELRAAAQAELDKIDRSVIGGDDPAQSRCWITRRRFDILTKALGA